MKKRKRSVTKLKRPRHSRAFNLRLPIDLHGRMGKEAWKAGRSLNGEIVHRLQISIASPELEFSITARDHLARAAANIINNTLKDEVECAMECLRKSFRDGPVLVHHSLTILARDIMHRELEQVIIALQQAQMNNARKEDGGAR